MTKPPSEELSPPQWCAYSHALSDTHAFHHGCCWSTDLLYLKPSQQTFCLSFEPFHIFEGSESSLLYVLIYVINLANPFYIWPCYKRSLQEIIAVSSKLWWQYTNLLQCRDAITIRNMCSHLLSMISMFLVP